MGLTKVHQALVAKVKAVGNSGMSIPLDDASCAYLLSRVVHDLELVRGFPELAAVPRPFFGTMPLQSLRIEGLSFLELFERLVKAKEDADSYFFCLATLHRARLKYERILQAQPLPTIDQVGPRGLLQFGSLSARALAAFLFWRKWIFDIDNRAGQETGYLFEPIIANSIGGVPASAKKSPVKRKGTGAGRQVDCVREVDKRAYEIKLRATIAASGQGRWQEELEFPEDCRASGYRPVLIVLDPTNNPKLAELQRIFIEAGGECHVGQAAWKHLEDLAGQTMATFLSRYVHDPIEALLDESLQQLPGITFAITDDVLTVDVAGEQLRIERAAQPELASGPDDVPDDVDGDASGL